MTIFQLSDTDTEKVRTMIRCLSTLQLHPYVTKSDDGCEYAKQHDCLVVSERTDLGLLLGKVWPHLTKLSLEGACVEAEDLISIVRAHRGNLRDLRLENISLLGNEGWECFGNEMGQILELHSVWAAGLSDNVTRGVQCREFVCGIMQWALPDLLEIEEHYDIVTGRLKADSL